MRVVVLDFETFWSEDYTLRKMTTAEYLASPLFQIISVSLLVITWHHGVPVHVSNVATAFGEAGVRKLLDRVDLPTAMAVGHNMSTFDSLILAKMGYSPRAYACTMAMARAVVGHETNVGLGALVKFHGIGVKNDAILHATKGKRLEDFTQEELMSMAQYNKDDVTQCAALFLLYLPNFPWNELFTMDCTIRAECEPVFELDQGLLEDALVREKAAKRTEVIDLAVLLGIDFGENDAITFEAVRARLASAPKFVTLLESLGVDPPYKPSPKNPKKFIPALAKTDEGFQELLDSDDELVAAAASARLSIKSTLLETRITRLLTARRTSVKLPLPYNYWGAKVSGRLSGRLYNPQNLPRIYESMPRNSDALRQSVIAPEGYVIGVADQSSIEMRVNHFLWWVTRSMKMYRTNAQADLYSDFAASRYRIVVGEVTRTQRQAGKVAHLGLGFGSGPTTLQRVARTQFGLKMEKDEAEEVTYAWRDMYHEIPSGWAACQESIPYMAEGTERQIDPGGLCRTVKDGIVLPSGRMIRYPHLRQALLEDPVTHKDRWEWVYGTGRFVRRLYGPKMDENIVQAIARDTIFQNGIDFFYLTKLRWKLSTHDELGYLFPVSEALELLAALQNIMRTPPKWWPSIVLWSEGGVARRYSDAK